MNFLKRLEIVVFGVAVLAAVGARPAVAQTKEARGQVTAVSDSSLTVQAGERSLTFFVDSATQIEASGVGTRSRQAKAAGVSSGIKVTDYVKTGRPVSVSYTEAGGKNHALTVRPIASAGSGGGAISEDGAKNVLGKVKSIAGAMLTLDVDGHDMTFAIDRETDIFARGASRVTRKGGVPIGDLVHDGDLVRVAYRAVNGSMKASEIQIRGRSTIAQ
jgi:hypothetical protein